MKIICFFLLSFFCWELYAQANYCEHLPLKPGEECRPLITFLEVRKVFKKCTGEFESGLSCRVLISMDETASLMSLDCKNQQGTSVIQEDIEADISFYQSSGIVTSVGGKEKVYTDPETILFSNHPMLQVSAQGARAKILYTAWNGEQELMSNVVCE